MSEKLQNINLEGFSKQQFTINNDPNKIIELDVSDLNVIQRFNEIYPKLQESIKQVSERTSALTDAPELDTLKELGSILKDIDSEMRELINYLFDFDVCSVCIPSGNMYDMVGGSFKFDKLIDALMTLYTENIESEVAKSKAKISKHTSKYTNKKA